ncbi:TetR/AcrR family transcriptional regulator, partial [Streptomyces sp. NPDC059233]
SEEHRERANTGNRRVFASLRERGTALGAAGAQDWERVTLALIDLPLTVVRRHLRAGEPMPPYAEDLAERCAQALLQT